MKVKCSAQPHRPSFYSMYAKGLPEIHMLKVLSCISGKTLNYCSRLLAETACLLEPAGLNSAVLVGKCHAAAALKSPPVLPGTGSATVFPRAHASDPIGSSVHSGVDALREQAVK
eukprot:scaffold191267_cov17-Tisochrysis_lutea.AAC.1